MAKRLQYKRLMVLAGLVVIAFGGLAYRLVDLQIFRYQELSVLAQQNTEREFFFEPRRGDILDCKGNLLATSISVKNVCADPSLMGTNQYEVAHALAPLLHVKEGDLYQQLLPRVRQNAKGGLITNSFVRLKTKVSVESWETIKTAMSHLTFNCDEKKLPKSARTFYQTLRQQSIFAQDYPLRVYPNQALAVHVLGFATTEEVRANDHLINQIKGRDGIELTMDSKLEGVPGWRLTETDSKGREMVALRHEDVDSYDGYNVVLTIDSVIQNILETEMADAMQKHAPVSISGIVVRPKSGEILAMATLPNYDPNDLSHTTPNAMRDRVITDVMEPGSTFKIVVVSGALNDQIVRLNDVFDCEHGRFLYCGTTLHDHESYGDLSVEQIITKSSNIGAAKIGIKMGKDRLYDYIRSFGFGESTKVPLPGEVVGIVHPTAKWSGISVAQIPMGQGIAVTRLQMVMAMCAIANRGCLMQPVLVDRLERENGETEVRYAPQMVRQVVNPATASLMVEALKTVVLPGGTAVNAALDHYTVAGKTGTAQKSDGRHYSDDKYIASFIGFFPADNPELCISIVLDEPKEGHFGGQVAAPVFKAVAERAASYLHIRPDIQTPAVSNVVAQAEWPVNRAVLTR